MLKMMVMVAVAMVAVAGSAMGYGATMCGSATGECGAQLLEQVWANEQLEVEFFLDIDGSEAAAGYDFFAAFSSGQMDLKNSERLGVKPEVGAGCTVEDNPEPWSYRFCHYCDKLLHCRAENFFDGDAQITADAEIKLTFVVPPTFDRGYTVGLFQDQFIVDERDENGVLVEVAAGAVSDPAGVLVYLPEPGASTMLSAGLALLWGLSSARRSAP